jgi:hypothetical protein
MKPGTPKARLFIFRPLASELFSSTARHPHAIHSSALLQAYDFTAPDALVGGKDDAQ